MPAAKDDRIDALIQEVRELKSDVKELRMLITYELLKQNSTDHAAGLTIRSSRSPNKLSKRPSNSLLTSRAKLTPAPGTGHDRPKCR